MDRISLAASREKLVILDNDVMNDCRGVVVPMTERFGS
jgi:hypothetical protein